MLILLSLLAGLCDACRDSLSKHHSGNAHRLHIALAYHLFAVPVLFPSVLFAYPYPWLAVDMRFFVLLSVVCLAHACAAPLLVRALSLAELSLCVPMSAFTPVFLLVIGSLVQHEWPTGLGTLGALSIVSGTYLINLGHSSSGLLGPFRALSENQGVRIMLGLSLLWSMTSSIDRYAVQHYEPTFWGCSQLAFIALIYLPVLWRKGLLRASVRQAMRGLVSVGLLNGVSVLGYLFAMKFSPAYYVVAVKRTSILFSVLIGTFIFGEKNLSGRLLGATLMVAGVALISIWGRR